jgi:choline kinase
VLDSSRPDALAVERRARFEAEEMKVELDGDCIRAMSKQLPPARAHAENLGVLKFSAEGAAALFRRMDELLAAGAEREMCPFVFNALAAERTLYAVPVEGLPWIEIDFAEDLLRAREQVWPAILARQPAAANDRVAATSPTAASSN